MGEREKRENYPGRPWPNVLEAGEAPWSSRGREMGRNGGGKENQSMGPSGVYGKNRRGRQRKGYHGRRFGAGAGSWSPPGA